METFAKHQEFRRQIASFYQQVIGQICRFRRIWPFCTRCDIGKDLSGHKTRERIKVTGVKFLQNSLVEDFKIPGLQCRMTVKCGWVCKARDTCSSTVI